MKNKIRLCLVGSVILASASAFALKSNSVSANAAEGKTYFVDFFQNYLREEFTLSSGFIGKGNNLIYKTVTVNADSLVEKPTDPARKNFKFAGWYLETTCETPWNFAADKVNKNTRLYAKWARSEKQEDDEPEYTPPSTVLEESASTDYVINSVMNFKIVNNKINVSTAALTKLEASKTNVLPLMEYKVKASKTITATYDEGYITVTCGTDVQNIQVVDNSMNLVVSNSTYETKAKKYEANALNEESYHVMLAGSSSIEFWTSSKEDLDPIVSYNHGIGGTTIEEWDECLNQRLVFPYKPKMVVYYVGINNVINSKQDAGTIWTNLQKFLNDTHEAMPNTKVQYIMMNLIPGYPTYYPVINSVNESVTNYQKNNSSWLTLINPGIALLKENGEPNAAYFRTDGLHLSFYGYVVWGGIIKESILKGLENY